MQSRLESLLSAIESALGTAAATDSPEFAPHFRDAEDYAYFREMFLAELAKMRAKRNYAPKDCSPGQWILYESDELVLRIILLDPVDGTNLVFDNADFAILPVHPGPPILVRRYLTDRRTRCDDFDADARLVEDATFELTGPYVFGLLPGYGSVHDFEVSRASLVLKASRTPRLPFTWSFDRSTLRPELFFPSEVLAARKGLILDYLDRAGHLRAEEVATGLLGAPEYFLRLQSLQTIWRLNPSRREELLNLAAQDEHASLRSLALRRPTLRNVE